MRGKVAKGLRKFAKKDMPMCEWELYTEVQMSNHSPNKTVRLVPECQKYHYRTLKQVWKKF